MFIVRRLHSKLDLIAFTSVDFVDQLALSSLSGNSVVVEEGLLTRTKVLAVAVAKAKWHARNMLRTLPSVKKPLPRTS